ncbi:HAD family hydrolase, partial [Acidovorax sp.]|uniref:HAD-IIIC family phosphatase n=1 Tax=Acidovorax sp. TaxID=1872122 RepID=UPI0025BEA879
MSKQDFDETLRRLANELTYSAYTATANALEEVTSEASHLPPLRVAILRNFTIEPMIPVIKGEIALAGFYPVIYLGDYDAIARDVLDPGSALYAFQPDFVIVAQWLETLAPTLVTRFLSLSPEQVNTEVERVLVTVNEIVTALRRHSKTPILVNNFPLPLYPTLGILDAQSENHQTHTILKLNLELLRRVRESRDVYLVDYMSLMARIGSVQGVDERYWQIGRAPIGRHALLPFGQEYGKFFRALHGKARKCLVLDCDNTLWGGVVGEDGLGGIQLGTAYPGSCYQAFQREILNLHDRGVILALCSRNNEADVLEVLRTHPEMVLREEHFATWQINWDDKVTNLMRIAQDLNIGLDSLVFVDDSQFECDFVRERLPQVTVLELSSDPSTFRAKLSAGGYFDALTFSPEDRKRTRMYRDEVQRKELYVSASSLEEYLAKLEMVAEISLADEMTIPRISQLTQKTNQFNLTTRRYSEGDIQAFVESPGADVFYLNLRDRISEMGLIGVAIVKYNGEQAEIDTFLLSCRAIGRGVEEALLAHVLNSAKSKGCSSVVGRYLITKKNGQVADF